MTQGLTGLNVCIVGLGLMGGSLGMALIRNGSPARVTGVDLDQGVIRRACERGAIHEGSLELTTSCKNADLVVFATPIGTIPGLVEELLPHLRDGAILTDLGSTKGFLYEAMSRLLGGGLPGARVAYVGGHPMTGSELSGIEAATPDLFPGSSYVICPPISCNDPEGRFSERAQKLLESVATAIGALPVFMEPHEHDLICAVTSHLPHMVACALVDILKGIAQDHTEARRLVAGGFRDVTRIASREPVMGGDILLTNREALKRALGCFQRSLDELACLVESGDTGNLRGKLAELREFRENLFKRGLDDGH